MSESLIRVLEQDEYGDLITTPHIIGALLMALIAGLSSLAGLGGGGPNVVVMLLFFNLLPKEATIVVFASILGSSFGSAIIQMQKALNGQPVINYQFAFLVLPLMFFGSLVGVFLNNWLPSAVIVGIIIGVASISLPKIFRRFKETHAQETIIINQRLQANRHSDIIREEKIDPFAKQINVNIFKQLLLLIFSFIVLSILRGSNKFPSLLGIESCSAGYWLLTIGMFALTLSFYFFNASRLQTWTNQHTTLGEKLFEKRDVIAQNKDIFYRNSLGAGMFSGFGLGGGIFLVPLFRQLGLSPLQASSTCTFTIFVTATMNVAQAMFLGILSPTEFICYFLISFTGSSFMSVVISQVLRRANRLSYVQLILFLLLLITNLYLPVSLWLKYEKSGHNADIIFGFGDVC